MSIPVLNSSLPAVMPTDPRPTAPAQAPGAESVRIQAAARTGTVAASGTGRPDAPASLQDVQLAMEEVRKAITPVAQDLLFSIDEDTGKTIVKVVDASTDEVIRQIPSEEIISIAKALDKLQGLLLKQEA